MNEKTGDNSFRDMISTAAVEDNKWIQWRPDVFQDIFKRRVYKQLPPKHEALSLLKDYFENFNCMFPLFHEPTFMHLVDKHYSKDPYEGSGWWASLNVALAFAHRLRVMSNLVPAEEDEKAWQYLKNAMSVMVELTMRNTDLLSVQALLGVVWEPAIPTCAPLTSTGPLFVRDSKPATYLLLRRHCHASCTQHRPPQEGRQLQPQCCRSGATKTCILDCVHAG